MMKTQSIKPFKLVNPMIYAYTTPGISYHDGWTKIGYTERQSVEERIKQQTHTADIHFDIEWQDFARYKKEPCEYFHDTDFHRFLKIYKKVENEKGTEWFKLSGEESRRYFDEFASRKYEAPSIGIDYILRKEQEEAVKKTFEFFKKYKKTDDKKYKEPNEFLWNAKPRFGKTLTTYDLIRKMNIKKVLIVTNRPSIANAWYEDFMKFIAWQKPPMLFVSEAPSLKDKPYVYTREEYKRKFLEDGIDYCMICFASLQDLKGSAYLGGNFDKYKWIEELKLDLLVVDESQEGVDTKKTEKMFDNIQVENILYLSGTPFKQLAQGKFSESQIFNWTYADEQEAKENWMSENKNPYERLPKMEMFTYQLSPMIYDKLMQGADFSENGKSEFAFDLNEFFSTNGVGTFIYKDEVEKFLNSLTTCEKYPFSTPELRRNLSHTLWILDRVKSAKALAKMLESHPKFKDYKIVVAAGQDTHRNEDDEVVKAYDMVKDAIAHNDKTITLSVGQLTVGVTIPEWSGVFMLCNLKSPSAYMQAAFRAQNPCSFTDENGQCFTKDKAYVFDFDPARTLQIYDEFANNLISETVAGKGTSDDRKENIKRLLNFFPVIGEDTEGKMVELDAQKILSIPRRLKCMEVVRRGFMSNLLFQNIGRVFNAPKEILEIINKMEEVKENKNKIVRPDINVDNEGNVEIPQEIIIGKTTELFGEKIYENLEKDIKSTEILPETPIDEIMKKVDEHAKMLENVFNEHIINPIIEKSDISKSKKNKIKKELSEKIRNEMSDAKTDYMQSVKIAEFEYEKKLKKVSTEEEQLKLSEEINGKLEKAREELNERIKKSEEKIIKENPKEVIERIEIHKATKEMEDFNDKMRDKLRAFTRAIPSFIMAYGDENMTLANLEDYTEDDVFKELTGITEEDFKKLRDGCMFTDEQTGESKSWGGNLFDEVTFNDSVKEFLKKKEELKNYFDENQKEDIFDWIPPQKTNQIFTPKKVVKQMVDLLEKENPRCFDDPNATFADLYMKSGLYITEIIKRLFRSPKLKELYPDEKERINHILNKQVYGMAPTRIIFLIAINYILGFDKTFDNRHFTEKRYKNFVQEDAIQASKKGILHEKVEYWFGE